MEQSTNCLFSHDALDQVISDPVGIFHWKKLVQLFNRSDDQDFINLVFQRLTNEVAPDGVIGFHRGIFLDFVFQHANLPKISGTTLAQIEPFHLDRVMAYVNYFWGIFFQVSQNHLQLQHAMDAANIPRLLQRANEKIFEISSLKPRKIEQVKRIAIYAPQIINLNHPPTMMILEQTKLLQSLGIEVRLFTCQEQQISNAKEYLINSSEIVNQSIDITLLEKFHFTSEVKLSFGNDQLSLTNRIKKIFELINEFNPDLCFFIGYQSPILLSLYQYRPLLALNISSNKPNGLCDIWLSALENTAHHPQSDALFHPYRINRKKDFGTINRESLHLPKDAIVLVTVGARLTHEINNDWAKNMLDVCQQFPQVVWLLVGGNGDIPSSISRSNQPQIYTISHVENLKGIYQHCDIYVNPPRIGGGFSVAEAMAEGVICLAYENTDGGMKLGDLALTNHNDYFKELRQLIETPALRHSRSNEMREIFKTKLNLENSLRSLERAIELCKDQFNQRTLISSV